MAIKLSRALLSVSDKTGIVELAQALASLDVNILSTGGTAQLILDQGIAAKEVSEHTGFPEIMDGRVKTLHPKIHGGILARRGQDDKVMAQHDIQPIDLIVVNLYPFEATTAKPDCTLAEAIENIDIGGPTMVRAAAKNYAHVAIVVDPDDYPGIIHELQTSGGISDETRLKLAAKAFAHTAGYEDNIANYLGTIVENASSQSTPAEQSKAEGFPSTFNVQFKKSQTMRYGENPHQRAAFYTSTQQIEASISTAQQLQGKALSYNNIADTDAALECVKQFTDAPACVIVKHANPCGVAVDNSLLTAYERAYQTDPESAFGGIIACNCRLDTATASAIVEKQFVEVIIAPSVSPAAIEIIKMKDNVRLLTCGEFDNTEETMQRLDFKRVNGGLLVQDADLALHAKSKIVTTREPTEQEMSDLLFAWKVAKYVKSNAIIYARDNMTIGVGAGQMSRVNSARIAGIKAEHAKLEVKGSVMASDAFFPFRDGIDSAAASGITAVIQPGGSLRDEEVIEAANEADIAMIYTGMRHFRH